MKKVKNGAWENEENEMDRREFFLERKGDRPKRT
jgi:hypothetical protein